MKKNNQIDILLLDKSQRHPSIACMILTNPNIQEIKDAVAELLYFFQKYLFITTPSNARRL